MLLVVVRSNIAPTKTHGKKLDPVRDELGGTLLCILFLVNIAHWETFLWVTIMFRRVEKVTTNEIVSG